ncbi:MAG: hypothetical protein IPN71_16280 [Fibrobacteres bacterium]|nr:hypothetical protein [Fibrobacterota bacterium]
MALEAGTHLIDLRAGFSGHPEWYLADSVHPNVAGAKALATLVANMLKHKPATIELLAVMGARPQASLNGTGYQWYRNDTLLAETPCKTLRSSRRAVTRFRSRSRRKRKTGSFSAPYKQFSKISTPLGGHRWGRSETPETAPEPPRQASISHLSIFATPVDGK